MADVVVATCTGIGVACTVVYAWLYVRWRRESAQAIATILRLNDEWRAEVDALLGESDGAAREG